MKFPMLSFKPFYSLFYFQWFDKKKAYLDGLESQLKGLVKAIDLVSKQRAGERLMLLVPEVKLDLM